MRTRRLASLLLLALPGSAWAEAACTPDRLDLRWDGGRESFAVEVADEGGERSQGLMFRPELAPASGMLFVYDAPRHVQFWMKNTLIPLDMLFFDAEGRLVSVHENAVPGDLTPIPGGEAIQYVLEINGGAARRLGIAPGAELRHPALDRATAAWPCPG